MERRGRSLRQLILFVFFTVRVLSWYVSLYVDFNEGDRLALELLPFVILLGHSNSAVNPLLYCLLSRHLHRSRSTSHRRRPVDITKPTPATAVGDCMTLQLLGQAVAGQDDRAIDATDGK